jgi:hypothetical protein
VWLDLKEEIELELAMLRELLESVQALRAQCQVSVPDLVETMALGAFLHAFYNGVENAFKRIAIHMDGGMPKGANWHQALLDSMNRPGETRPAVISPELRHLLEAYLDFRHRFRNLYTHKLDWELMADLVHGCENTLDRLERELSSFLEAAGHGTQP